MMTPKESELIAAEHEATSQLLDVARELDALLLSTYPPDVERVPDLVHALGQRARQLIEVQDEITAIHAVRLLPGPEAIQ
jgi:hypothetical protein